MAAEQSFAVTVEIEQRISRELLRLLAHLVLALVEHQREAVDGQQLDVQAVDGIVENYVDYLIQQGRHPRLGKYNTMVALYLSKLSPAVQVTKYAALLEGTEHPSPCSLGPTDMCRMG